MKVGDLVVAIYDEERDITAIGVILETLEQTTPPHVDVKVLWSTETNPIGWWRSTQLRVISPVS
jgi:hypothetical protein|tara:strand:- start:3146 stop:3337 length:192 start_codon:yes stop_codon:yes gene_type:complete